MTTSSGRPLALLLKAGAFAAGIAAVDRFAQSVSLSLLSVPLVTSIAVACTMPQSDAARPRSIIGGHGISFCLTLIAHSTAVPPVVTAAIILVAMQIASTPHPPAALTPFLVAAHADLASRLALPLAAGCLVAAGIAFALRRIENHERFPVG